MIPSKNENNCNQKIKIQLTSDNKCIIKSTIESAEKSKATINKSEYSINIPDLKDINDNELLTLSKSLTNNQNNDNEANSNLLISFSNISELNKTGDLSLWMGGEQIKNQNLNENKENIDLNNGFVNINLNDKRKSSVLSNKNNKSKDNKKDNSNIFDYKKKINKKYIKDKNNLIENKKIFKNIKSQNTDNLNIIHLIEKKVSKGNNIITNHCTNFSFGGNNSNNNNTDNIKNEDYVSPTFNVKINYNSLESNNIENNIIKNESRNKNNKINQESKMSNNSLNIKLNNNNDKFKKMELSIKNSKKNNNKKKNLSSSNLLPKEKFHNQTSLDRINHNKGLYKQKPEKYLYLNSNRTFNQNLLSRLSNNNKNNKSFTNIKMSSNKSSTKLFSSSASSPKNSKEKKNNLSIKSNSNSSASRNLISTSKILLKKNKSSVNINFREKILTNKNMSNKIKIPNKEKDLSTSRGNSKNKNRNILRRSPIQKINKINKFNLITKRVKSKKKSPPKILDKSEQNSHLKNEKIQEQISKTSLNTYRKTKNDGSDLIKNKKNSSLVYSRKRNLDERYNKIFNNSSNNSSKDSTRIYHSIINRSLQSIDKNKNKISDKKRIFINNTILNDQKNLLCNDINKNKNKKFIAIQNFSRYKKKSILFYKNKNNETNINTNNNYFITDKKF